MEYPDHLTILLEDFLGQIDYGEDSEVSPLCQAMNYSLLAGGKRIRPVLMMAAGEMFGRPAVELLPTAAAIEMIHTYSLIHDDLPAFDNDDLRRGMPTCHIKYGESVAILAGDALFAEAYRLICEKQAAIAEVKLKVIDEISVATGVRGMVGGQYLDVAGAEAVEAGMRLLHSLKTGRLIMACVHCGGLLAGAPEKELEKLRLFAAELGLLFQIKYDILDVVGETAILGKQAGTDERLERSTYVSVFGLERSEEMAAGSRDKALAALGEIDADTEGLAGITTYIHERQR
ncbi:MAG: polyprenyl synthetase family protein [Thermoleophilia bacterium]